MAGEEEQEAKNAKPSVGPMHVELLINWPNFKAACSKTPTQRSSTESSTRSEYDDDMMDAITISEMLTLASSTTESFAKRKPRLG
jgi:hypothetical protein